MIHGTRISLGVGLGAVALSIGAGLALGSLAGMREGAVDAVVMRTMDVLFAFPAILLALALIAVLGSKPRNVVLAIGLVYLPVFARTVRAAVLTIKHREFVEAAHALGRGDLPGSFATSCRMRWRRCWCRRASASRRPSSPKPR